MFDLTDRVREISLHRARFFEAILEPLVIAGVTNQEMYFEEHPDRSLLIVRGRCVAEWKMV